MAETMPGTNPANPPPADLPSEPSAQTGAIAAAVGLVISLAVSFGLPLTEQQQLDLLKLVVIGYPFVIGGIAWIIRQRVYAPATTQAYRLAAYVAGRERAPLPPLAKPPGNVPAGSVPTATGSV